MPIAKPGFSPSYIEAFRKLHEAFSKLITLEPWTIVHESLILGVQHPDNGGLYYAYFMGEMGDVVGFNLYKADDIPAWLEAREEIGDEQFVHHDLLTQSFYQLTAEMKTGLAAEIKELHAAAGIIVPRGKRGFLEAIRYKGGYTPAMMAEAAIAEVTPLIPGLIYLLENIDNESLDDPGALDADDVCYIAQQQPGGGWTATEQPLPEPEDVRLFDINPPEPDAWAALNIMPRAKEAILIHTELLPLPTDNGEGIGIFPLAVICIGAKSGMIHGIELLNVDNWKTGAAPAVLKTCKKLKLRPTSFLAADSRALPLAEACAGVLGIPATFDEDAGELLDEVMESLRKAMGF